MFKRCLICTNFQDRMNRFANYVPDLVKSGFEKIIFYHNIDLAQEGEIPDPNSPQFKKAQEILAPALVSIPEGVEVKTEFSFGNPATAIPRLVETYGIDLLMVATAAQNSLQEKIFGSTTEAIAKTISIPMLIFRPQLLAVYTNEEIASRCQNLFRYLLIPYADSDSGNYLIERLVEVASNRAENSFKECMLVSVVDDNTREPLITKQKIEQATKKLETIKTELEKLSLKVNTQVSVGVPWTEIIKVGYDEDITGIAMARVNMARIMQLVAPSLAQEFLIRSWFPLLFFSPKG